MYRSDKPATATSRIFIGNIAETVLAADLEAKFRNYGNILGIVLQPGFASIQYESDEQVQAAIRNERDSMFHGRKLKVAQIKRFNDASPSELKLTSALSAPPAPQFLSTLKPVQASQPVLQMQISPSTMPSRDMPLRNMPSRGLPLQDIPSYHGKDDPYQSGPEFAPSPVLERPDQNDCEAIVLKPLTLPGQEKISTNSTVVASERQPLNTRKRQRILLPDGTYVQVKRHMIKRLEILASNQEMLTPNTVETVEAKCLLHNLASGITRPILETKYDNTFQSETTRTSTSLVKASPNQQLLSILKSVQAPQRLLQKRISPPHQDSQAGEMDTSIMGNNFSDTQGKQSESQPNFQARSIDGSSDTSERRRHRHRGGFSFNNRSRERHHDHHKYSPEDFNMREMPLYDLPPRDIFSCDILPRDRPPRDLPSRGCSLYYGGDAPHRPESEFAPPSARERPDRNDCEIIVISRVLIEYAKCIKKRLESVGLVVDLSFPNEDVPLGRVLTDISSRGCLYAIFILPQNELHCSLTLSILHGIPQEHRNIPVDDAIVLIIGDFDAYMRREKSTSAGAAPLMYRHPEPIQMLLSLLAENRLLTVVQYDRLVKYLKERRELQSQYEITEGVGECNMVLELNSKQADLQNRIVSGQPVCHMASDPGIIPLAASIQETTVPEKADHLEKKLTKREKKNRRRVRIPTGKGDYIKMRRDDAISLGLWPFPRTNNLDGGESSVKLEPNNKQADLQSRIMDILNKSAEDSSKLVGAPVPSPPDRTSLLNDPSIQRVLDNLLSGNMF